MANYAESVVYWYLRLNGFFPLTRYVMHGQPGRRTTDCDLLAIRPAGVFEEIDGQPLAWDRNLFDMLNIDNQNDSVGLIVEVKGGIAGDEPNLAGATEHFVSRGVQRLGVSLPPDGLAQLMRDGIAANNAIPGHRGHVARLVFARNAEQMGNVGHFFRIPLSHADEFIRQRFRDYRQKVQDWHFFGDDVIQYMIWDEMRQPAI